MLAGGLQLPLWPVQAGDGEAPAPGLWEASVRVRRLDEAVLTVIVAAARHDEPLFGRPVGAPVVFRGRAAPADPAPGPLAGELREHVLDSAALGGPRGVTVYLPPGLSGGSPAPGCVLADGQSAAGFAPALDAAIRAGTAPPVVLAGVHNAHVRAPGRPGPPRADPRALEYLPRLRSRRFAAHMAFVTGEVIPWAAGQFPVAPGPWTAAGYSNGAVWAIAAGQRRPEVFGRVAALSAGMAPPDRRPLPSGAALPGRRDARGRVPAGDQRVGGPAPAGRPALRLPGVGGRARSMVVAPGASGRPGVAARLGPASQALASQALTAPRPPLYGDDRTTCPAMGDVTEEAPAPGVSTLSSWAGMRGQVPR